MVILSPVDSNPAALYFTIHGGPEKVYLNSVLSRSVIRSEVHESKVDPKTGMVTMEPTRKIEIPAKGTVEFKRGGKHVMLWGVNRPARQLKELEAEFIFSNGDRIEARAGVIAEVPASSPSAPSVRLAPLEVAVTMNQITSRIAVSAMSSRSSRRRASFIRLDSSMAART